MRFDEAKNEYSAVGSGLQCSCLFLVRFFYRETIFWLVSQPNFVKVCFCPTAQVLKKSVAGGRSTRGSYSIYIDLMGINRRVDLTVNCCMSACSSARPPHLLSASVSLAFRPCARFSGQISLLYLKYVYSLNISNFSKFYLQSLIINLVEFHARSW